MPASPFSADQPGKIAERLLGRSRRLLVYGEMGIGKSTLAMELAQCLGRSGTALLIIGADPGMPAFGIPGAVCAGKWREEGIQLLNHEALCSLNAGRFRLPLIQAVTRLIAAFDVPLLLIDAPGVTRGVAGSELLMGLIEAAAVDTVLAVVREGKRPPMQKELEASGVAICPVTASGKARPLTSHRRRQTRTLLWETHLFAMPKEWIPLHRYTLVGTPPPVAAGAQWRGRQIALREKGCTVAMGEVLAVEENGLWVRLPKPLPAANQLLIRDAGRNADGKLITVHPFHPRQFRSRIPPDCLPEADHPTGPGPVAKFRRMTAILVNGILGDPLLHLRLHNRKQSLLFDLGEGRRLPARIAHQVSHVFISHAHMDHISGFLWLLRARIGELPACRIFGPPGLARHIAGMIDGVCWDRIGRRGPIFDIFELHGCRLEGFRLQAGGEEIERLGQRPTPDGIIVDDPAFAVRAVTLDHGIPVLALSFEQKPGHNLRRKALEQSGYPSGPWVGELKYRFARGEADGEIVLPDGRRASLAKLADDLIRITPGEKLVYATDIADTASNREQLIQLARDAHTFFCEASFLSAHQSLAISTGHLTARACGEIAAEAGARRLVPFHLSKRYDHQIDAVMEEVRQRCPDIDLLSLSKR